MVQTIDTGITGFRWFRYTCTGKTKIVENEKLTDEEISIKRGKNNANKFENEVAFARSYLVKQDILIKVSMVYGHLLMQEKCRNDRRISVGNI